MANVLNHEKINKNSQRISDIKPFIDRYEWNEIKFPAEVKNWKKFEANNKTITCNVLFSQNKKEQIKQICFSKHS